MSVMALGVVVTVTPTQEAYANHTPFVGDKSLKYCIDYGIQSRPGLQAK
jgi:hypothetical protein